MNCPTCRAEAPPNAEMCAGCGKPLFDLEPGVVLASRYVVQGLLGRGGMGSVHKAHDRVLDETVALKILKPHFARAPEIAQRFRTEIKLARKIRNPNVCAIHEYGDTDGIRYLSMEFVDGVTLREKIRETGGLQPPEALEIAGQILSGLQAVHDVGIIHRDLKTPNIMLDTAGLVRLMDFGMAKQRGVNDGGAATAIGQIMGTPEFMSPEQAKGERADFQSDIYAMGVVLYELLTGTVPFRGATLVDVMLKHVHEEPPLEGPAAAKIPLPLVPILKKALAKSPADRYASARGMAAALRQATMPEPAPAVVDVLPRGNGHADADVPPRPLPLALTTPRTASAAGLNVPVLDGSDPAALRERIQGLVRALKDPDASARWSAALTLGECGPAARDAAGPLITALDDMNFWVGEAAATALRKITGTSGPGERRRNRGPAAPAPVPPAVVSLLKSMENPATRWMAVVALGELGATARDAIPALVDAIDDEDSAVRWDAVKALGKMGPAAASAVPALIAVLGDPNDVIARQYAVAALGSIGARAGAAVPALIGAFKDRQSHLDDKAGEALVLIGAASVPALIEAMKDEDPTVRVRAANVLTRIAVGS